MSKLIELQKRNAPQFQMQLRKIYLIGHPQANHSNVLNRLFLTDMRIFWTFTWLIINKFGGKTCIQISFILYPYWYPGFYSYHFKKSIFLLNSLILTILQSLDYQTLYIVQVFFQSTGRICHPILTNLNSHLQNSCRLYN